MTVRRVGPAPEEAAPHRTNLGRVLVTIDDLKALMDFLTRGSKGLAAQIKAEFDGGDFTEPEELITLSNTEAESLRLKTSRVEVVLNPSAAFAVGDRQEAEDVYRIWARTRQTRLRPRPIPLRFLLALLTFAIFVLFAYILMFSQPSPTGRDVLVTTGVLSFGFILLCTLLWHDFRREMSSYAVIVPSSLAEHRQSQSSQMYPRRSWIVAIVAVIVALVSVGVLVWSKIFSP